MFNVHVHWFTVNKILEEIIFILGRGERYVLMLILDYVVTVYSREWTVTATRYKLDKEISEPPRQRERKSKSKSDERENRKNIKSVKEREGERERITTTYCYHSSQIPQVAE
ncbi:MAG: hypothetical protein ACI8RD_010883 [Bacillariaceae sp.]